MDNSNQSNLTSQLPSQPQPTAQTYYKHSGFITRLLALIIDGIIILALSFLLNLIVTTLTDQTSGYGKGSPFQLIATLVSLVYEITLVTLYSATFGKMLLHIKVVSTNYQKVSFVQVLKRETIGRILSGLVFNLGYLWVAIDDKKQAWHDKIANTYVIYTQPVTHEEYIKLQERGKLGSLPYVLVFTGLAEAAFVSIFALFVVRQLTALYETMGTGGYSPLTTYLMLGVIGLSCLAQVIWGAILWSKKKAPETISQSSIKTAKVLLILGATLFFLLIPFLVLSVILPIYKLTIVNNK